MLFSSKRGCRPGPKGPAKELIDAVVGIKRRNPTWGCPRIAQQITLAFGVEDVVRRILGKHYRPESGSGSPSWLTFLGQAKDSLWSTDLFRCESLSLRTHWVLVVMDQFTRRIIGFGIRRGTTGSYPRHAGPTHFRYSGVNRPTANFLASLYSFSLRFPP
jgi:hypothetical protein